MTDFEKFTNLMDSFGIPYKVVDVGHYLVSSEIVHDPGTKAVSFEAKSAPNVNGYNGFGAEFLFDSRGNSVGLDIFE